MYSWKNLKNDHGMFEYINILYFNTSYAFYHFSELIQHLFKTNEFIELYYVKILL